MNKLEEAGISWVILGSQTKPYKPPKIEWVQEIVESCDKAGIPVFLNGLQDNCFWEDCRDEGGFEPLHMKLRQEMPREKLIEVM